MENLVGLVGAILIGFSHIFFHTDCSRVGWGYSDRFFAHFLSYRLYYFAQVY